MTLLHKFCKWADMFHLADNMIFGPQNVFLFRLGIIFQCIGRREGGSGWGTHVYLWRIHVDVWQNQYNIVKLPTKVHLIKAIVFPVVIYGCESWTVKKAGH